MADLAENKENVSSPLKDVSNVIRKQSTQNQANKKKGVAHAELGKKRSRIAARRSRRLMQQIFTSADASARQSAAEQDSPGRLMQLPVSHSLLLTRASFVHPRSSVLDARCFLFLLSLPPLVLSRPSLARTHERGAEVGIQCSLELSRTRVCVCVCVCVCVLFVCLCLSVWRYACSLRISLLGWLGCLNECGHMLCALSWGSLSFFSFPSLPSLPFPHSLLS
jgi:hypothetical protein